MKKFLNIFQSVAKYGALFGFGFYVFFFKTASQVKAVTPDADLADITGEFYKGMASLTSEHFINGAGIVLSETFKMATDYVLPGIGTALITVAEALAPEPRF